MKKTIIAIGALLILLPPSGLWADWIPNGASLNKDLSHNADGHALAINNDTPYIIWHEDNAGASPYGFVYVSHYNGTNWESDGEVARYTNSPGTISFINSTVYTANSANGPPTISVYRLNGTNWNTIASGNNIVTSNYAGYFQYLCSTGSLPYITWSETTSPPAKYEVAVKHYTGSSWALDGGGYLNFDTNQDALYPKVVYNGVYNVFWQESNGSHSLIRLKYLAGTWMTDNSTLYLNMDVNHDAFSPSAVANGSLIYATWSESNGSKTQIYVKQRSGVWSSLGGSLNIDPAQNANTPWVASFNSTPYVAWSESNGSKFQIYVKHYNGAAWVQDVGSLNVDAGQDATNPQIAISSKGIVYVAWQETTSTTSRVYVKHLEKGFVASVLPNYSLPDKTVRVHTALSGYSGIPVFKLTRSGYPDIPASNAVQNTPQNISCDFDLSGAEPGAYDLQAQLNGDTAILKQAFFVLNKIQPPISWAVTDMGQAGSISVSGTFYGLQVGDPDNNGSQEVLTADLDQKPLLLAKSAAGWSLAALPSGPTGENYTQAVICDGDCDGAYEVYGSTLNNHVYEFKDVSWIKTSVGIGDDKIYDLAQGDGDNDGKPELYAACANGHVYQFKKSFGVWTRTDIGSSTGAMNAVTVGDGDSDGAYEVYGACANRNVYQFRYNGASWSTSLVGTGTGSMLGVACGDADRDSRQEVYGTNGDQKIYMFKYSITSWTPTEAGSAPDKLYKVTISDGDNDGQDEAYCACGDGHVYRFYKNVTTWNKQDLGSASVPLFAVACGDGENNGQFAVYAAGSNNHVYQFKAVSIPTATSTATAISTPINAAAATSTPTIIPIPDADKKLKVFHSQINPNHGEQARIRWYQTTNATVNLVIYNLLGDKITTLAANASFAPDQLHEVTWNGKNSDGTTVASGIYIVYLQSGEVKAWSKVAVIR